MDASAKKQKKRNMQNNELEFPIDWDIDAYRTEHESEEHWQLRRLFMETHKTNFPEDRLVCLAQLFTNMEFMGCKYPAEAMRLVGELSKDVAKDFRLQRAKKLKRTFVAASDAAEMRAKGLGSVHRQKQEGIAVNGRLHFGTEQKNKEEPRHADIFKSMPYGQMVLYLSGGRGCIKNSAQRCGITYEERVSPHADGKCSSIYIHGKHIAEAVARNVKEAKAEASNIALETLQRNCYSIKQNLLYDVITIEKNNNQVTCGLIKHSNDAPEEKKLDVDNKGYQIMKLMGWSGGGLGKKTQGREDPVSYLLKTNRAGLGSRTAVIDLNYFKNILNNYISSTDIRDLQFEKTFTKEDRVVLHQLAQKLNLKSQSHGQGNDRHLTVSKKHTNEEILLKVLIEKDSQFKSKYYVQVPEMKFGLFPDHTTKLTLDNCNN